MNEEEIKELEKALQKARFILSQKAGALHDLIEDRLPVDYRDIPSYADETYKACQQWDEINEKLIEIRKKH